MERLYFEYTKGMDEFGLGCYCGGTGENDDSTFRSDKDKLPNFKAAIYGESGDSIFSNDTTDRRVAKLMAWE